MTYKCTATAINIYRDGENPIFGESVTTIRIDDEGGGAFFVLSQSKDSGYTELRLDPSELELIADAAKRLLEQYQDKEQP